MTALVVLDTQSVLDWLVFADPACADWPQRLDAGWRWVHTPAMKAEFDYVAARGFGPRWPVVPEALERAWSSFAHPVEAPPLPGAAARLRCSDPDDQMFIDLAVALRAGTLVTRDRALLKLARRAGALHGVRICTPHGWNALAAEAAIGR